jgi:hypothetical protein
MFLGCFMSSFIGGNAQRSALGRENDCRLSTFDIRFSILTFDHRKSTIENRISSGPAWAMLVR